MTKPLESQGTARGPACFYCHMVHPVGPCPATNYAVCHECGVMLPYCAHPPDSSSAALPASEAISDTEAFRRLAHAMQQAPNKETQALMDAVKRLSSLCNYDKYRIVHALATEATVAALEKALKEERDTWRSSEVAALTAERDVAMKVLDPNMPESGLVDACRQVKQAAISSIDNCAVLEAVLTAQSATLEALEEKWRKEAEQYALGTYSREKLTECADDLHAARLRGASEKVWDAEATFRHVVGCGARLHFDERRCNCARLRGAK